MNHPKLKNKDDSCFFILIIVSYPSCELGGQSVGQGNPPTLSLN